MAIRENKKEGTGECGREKEEGEHRPPLGEATLPNSGFFRLGQQN
jgi:hypothetical protein